MNEKIPKNVLKELEFKVDKKPIRIAGKIIAEAHQVSIRLPKEIKAELDLSQGSHPCEIELIDNKTLKVHIK